METICSAILRWVGLGQGLGLHVHPVISSKHHVPVTAPPVPQLMQLSGSERESSLDLLSLNLETMLGKLFIFWLFLLGG